MSLIVGNCLFSFVQECHIHDFFMKRCSGRVKVKLNLNSDKNALNVLVSLRNYDLRNYSIVQLLTSYTWTTQTSIELLIVA